jgi:hypothetical protein
MGSLTTNLTLTSAADNITSDALNITINKILTTVNPVNSISRTEVSNIGDKPIIGAGGTDTIYMYVKNLDEANDLDLKDAAGTIWGKLSPGEATLFAVYSAAGFHLRANLAPVIAEYGFWYKS